MLDLPIIYDEHPQQEQVINQCIIEVAEAYRVDPLLLRAIREQERGDIGLVKQNPDGSWDLGPFQINTIHLPELERYFGITQHRVVNDACLNTAVAGWHLRNKINENNGDIWKGVAWYHSKTPHIGSVYRGLVKNIYLKLKRKVRTRMQAPTVADSGEY